MERRGDDTDLLFSPVVSDTIRVQLEQLEVTSSDITPFTSSDKPAFGSRPNTKAASLIFEAEVNCLPFKLNFGQDAKMMCSAELAYIYYL